MSAELKPCPFCGGEADIAEDSDRLGRAWTVFCVVCDGSTGLQVDAEAAIAEWSRRTPTAPVDICMTRTGRQRIDAAADILSKVLALVYAPAYQDEVSKALSGLRALQSLATPAPGAPGQEAAAVQAEPTPEMVKRMVVAWLSQPPGLPWDDCAIAAWKAGVAALPAGAGEKTS